MKFQSFDQRDLAHLAEFEPPGWGDLVPRFQYFLASEKSFPIKLVHHEKMIGIGTSIFHEDSAWLACIIIHPAYRSRGLGALLTKKLIDLIPDKIKTISLIATDLGFPVYQNLNFITEAEYCLFQRGDVSSPFPENQAVRPFEARDLKKLLNLDLEAADENRSYIIKDHLTAALVFENENRLQGFYLPKFDNGLIIAENAKAGTELMKYRIRDFPHAMMPEMNFAAIDFLKANNFTFERKIKRMYLGEKRKWKATFLYNRISGQLG